MLILTRKNAESLIIGENVKITVLDIKKDQVKIGIHAPKDIGIYREEIYERIQAAQEEQKKEKPISIQSQS